MSKEVKKEKNVVYVLTESYKDNDPETIGAYDSLTALCQGFARNYLHDSLASLDPKVLKKKEDLEAYLTERMNTVARMIPALIRCDWAEDECRDGRSVYGWDVLDVESSVGADPEEVQEEAN